MQSSLIHSLHNAPALMRSISATVIVTFTMLILTPTVHAVDQQYQEYKQAQRIEAIENAPDGLFSRILQKIKEKTLIVHTQSRSTFTQFDLKTDQFERMARGRKATPKETDKAIEEALSLHKQIPLLKSKVTKDLSAKRKALVAKNLPPEIIHRHDEFVAQFNERYQRYTKLIEAIKTEIDPAMRIQAVEELDRFLSKQQFQRSHQKFDPDNLPVNVPDGKIRKPAETKEEFTQLELKPENPIQLASSQLTSSMLAMGSNSPSASDLQSGEEIQITDDIRALAGFLENNPVRIVNWVKNNIDFLPTYGSIQGSEMTLASRQGNAFDTSSLLIALLRAANIHARYVYGTVEIPIEKVMNWIGGVTEPMAALQLLGQGGIPNTGLASGGKIVAVRLEHIWVEAWIDFHPSRGAKHKKGDSWIPIDGSFKQYVYPEGINLESPHFASMKTEMERVFNTVDVNQTDSYVQGIDRDMFRNMLLLGERGLWDYQDEKPDADRGRSLITTSYPMLASGLPYRLVSQGYIASSLPESARHTLTYKLYSSYQQQTLGSYDFEYHAHYSELAGKELKLGFIPASDADRETLHSYFPNIQPGVIITKDQLPDSIPGYLIYMKPVLTLNGEIVAQGSPVPIGQELVSSTQIKRLSGSKHLIVNTLVAGESQVIRLSMGTQPTVKETINVVDRNPNRVLQNTSTSFFGHLYYANEALNVLNKIVSYQHPSVGTFSTELVPEYWFGLPKKVSFGSLQVDLDIVEHSVVSRDNNSQDTKKSVNALGMMASILEGEIPAIFGSSTQHPTKSVSAMHALAAAMQMGMKIYTINSSNQHIINTLAIGEEVKTDIRNAINSGREIVVPEGNVLIGDWVGAGYIINDPATGSGIYRISGGLNGGKMSTTDITLALGAIGLDNKFFLNAVIPVANADVGSCEEDEDGDDDNNITINWQVILVIALLLFFIFLLIRLFPPAGAAGVAVASAMVLLFISLNKAQAAGKGCPTYVSGMTSSRGNSMAEATAHVKSAIQPGKTDELTYQQNTIHTQWYKDEGDCAGNKTEDTGKSCDEYPFFATFEGGPGNWGESGEKWVSLRLIKAVHNNIQGGTLTQFYKKCGLSIADKFKVKTSDGVTERLDKDGKPCGFKSHVK